MNFDNLKKSALATAFAEVVTLPICTIKTQYQNTSSNSIYATALQIYKKEGLPGFYKASVPAILSQTFSTSSKYVLYRYLEEKQYAGKMINGMVSGLISSLFTHPIDSVKIHWQMRTPFLPEYYKHGPGLLYRGYTKTVGKMLVSSSLFFPMYDYFYEKSNKNAALAAFGSAMTSTTIMQPLDYLKTRHIYGLQLYQGLHPSIYYKGLSLNLFRVVPHFMIVMTSIEYLNKWLKSTEKSRKQGS